MECLRRNAYAEKTHLADTGLAGSHAEKTALAARSRYESLLRSAGPGTDVICDEVSGDTHWATVQLYNAGSRLIRG